MGFWQLMLQKDDLIIRLLNSIIFIKNHFHITKQKNLRRMKKRYYKSFLDQSTYIILNGPSLKNQDISKLKGKNIMFVNRGFKHNDYKYLQPTFHVFVDPKLKNGEWPITWLDEILEMVPNITFVMPVDWCNLNILKPYIKRGVPFLWMPLNNPLTCLGVSGYCFETAMFCGFKNIFFTGFDANGLAYELIEHQSHFYGKNEENASKNSKNYVIDLYMHSRHLRDLQTLAKKTKSKGFHIINLTDGGILDMFPRKKLEESIHEN